MVGPAAVRVLGDVEASQPHLALVHRRERVDERRLALAHALDLGPDERDAGLEGVEDLEIVPGLAIARHHAAVGTARRRALLVLLVHAGSPPRLRPSGRD